MTRYRRTSTFSLSAVSFAVASIFTLNPMMIAEDALARVTSDSLMAPTPPWIHFTTTSSLESLSRDCFTASTEPATSALMIRFSSFKFPDWIWEYRSSRDIRSLVSSSIFSRLSLIKVSANVLASLSLSGEMKISPAIGTSLRPRISTGVDGPASFTRRPLSSIIARTLP